VLFRSWRVRYHELWIAARRKPLVSTAVWFDGVFVMQAANNS
jgi:hypothetical protein